jgi:hypothetical protein
LRWRNSWENNDDEERRIQETNDDRLFGRSDKGASPLVPFKVYIDIKGGYNEEGSASEFMCGGGPVFVFHGCGGG